MKKAWIEYEEGPDEQGRFHYWVHRVGNNPNGSGLRATGQLFHARPAELGHDKLPEGTRETALAAIGKQEAPRR